MLRALFPLSLVLAAGLLAGCAHPAESPGPAAGGSAEDGSAGIVARGEGKVTGTPDTLTVVLGVQTQAPTARAALDAANARSTAVIGLLKSRGVAGKDLRTSQLSIDPVFGAAGGRITGYQVSNLVTATLHDIAGAGTLIDAAAGAAGDAVRVQQVSFSIADDGALRAQAREAAVRQAKDRAEQMAHAAGVSLGALRSVSESTEGSPRPYGAQLAPRAGADSAVPVEPGSQDVTVQVSMVYTIDQ